MSIIIGCDSFLALRNVRSGGLGRWLAGESVHVHVSYDEIERRLNAMLGRQGTSRRKSTFRIE